MDNTALIRLGLTVNDVSIFTALASLGKAKTGAIMATSGIGSSQTYLSLGRLIKRGLVSYQVRNNVRYYQAEVPDTLIHDAEETMRSLEYIKKSIVKAPLVTERNFVNTFETKDGFKKAFLRHIDTLKRGAHISIIGFSTKIPDARSLHQFLDRCNEIVVEKRCSVRLILDERVRGTKAVPKAARITVRFMPASQFAPSAVNISEDEVLLSVWGKNPIAISITEPSVVQSFQSNFETQWSVAK